MPHDSANVLGGRSSSTSIVEGICLVGWEAKGDACRHFETMGEGVDPALYSRVVVEGVAVEVAEFRGVPLQGGASEGRGNVGFYKGSPLEGDQALKTLDKQHHVPVVNILANQHYFALAIGSIKVGVEVAQVGLILSLCCGLW